MPIPHETRDIATPGQSVISREVWIFELGDVIFCEIESDFMVDGSKASA
jgi:hypothetical protein